MTPMDCGLELMLQHYSPPHPRSPGSRQSLQLSMAEGTYFLFIIELNLFTLMREEWLHLLNQRDSQMKSSTFILGITLSPPESRSLIN